MSRPVSPLLHDYKPSPGQDTTKPKPLRWFAVGLGLPLIGLGLILVSATNSDPVPLANVTVGQESLPGMSASEKLDTDVIIGPQHDSHLLIELDHDFHPPLWSPLPDYDSIQLTVKSGDTLDRLFRSNKLNLGHLATIVRLPEASAHLKKLRPGDELMIKHEDGDLISLYRELGLTSALMISRQESGFSAEIVDRPVEVRKRRAYGRIESSLFESGSSAGLSDKVIMNLAGIFAWDIDFVLDIRQFDDYYLLYEELYQDGEYVSDGAIIAAEFNNNGRSVQAIRFVDSDGRSDYYTPDGRSMRKAFLRAPVDFTRISSSFNPRRRHPVLNTIRAHRGVDYAAPKGTPIKAAGDGKIIFRGVKGGYGNAVILQHGGNITTLYAHMSAFDRKAGMGKRVTQGQTIGYVGATGLVTAAHLHYEYRLNGVHRNPRTVELPQAKPIANEYKQQFLTAVEPILDELLQYKRTQIAALTAR